MTIDHVKKLFLILKMQVLCFESLSLQFHSNQYLVQAILVYKIFYIITK